MLMQAWEYNALHCCTSAISSVKNKFHINYIYLSTKHNMTQTSVKCLSVCCLCPTNESWFNSLPYMVIERNQSTLRSPERTERWREACSIVVFPPWCKVSFQTPSLPTAPSSSCCLKSFTHLGELI